VNVDRELILKVAGLARSSPQSWSEFLTAFRNYTDQTRDQCISSPLEELVRNQGRAQQCTALLTLFDEALKRADQMTEKRK
jgi:hypothetical protein